MTTIGRKSATAGRKRTASVKAKKATKRVAPFVAEAEPDKKEKKENFNSASIQERQLTMDWFDTYEAGLDSDIEGVREALKEAAPDDKDGLRKLKANLEGERARAAQQQEAFFTDKTLELFPPGDDEILRTKSLTEKMDALIREQKRAEAVVTLLNDLADVVGRIGV